MNETMELPKQELLLAEHKFINPLTRFSQEARPRASIDRQVANNTSKSLNEPFSEFLPEQKHEEKDIQEARKILGEKADKFTREQLKDVITEIKYLVSTWLDEVERELFDGQTLNELLHEKERI